MNTKLFFNTKFLIFSSIIVLLIIIIISLSIETSSEDIVSANWVFDRWYLDSKQNKSYHPEIPMTGAKFLRSLQINCDSSIIPNNLKDIFNSCSDNKLEIKIKSTLLNKNNIFSSYLLPFGIGLIPLLFSWVWTLNLTKIAIKRSGYTKKLKHFFDQTNETRLMFHELMDKGLQRFHFDNQPWNHYIKILKILSKGLSPLEFEKTKQINIYLFFPGNIDDFLSFIESEHRNDATELFKVLDALIKANAEIFKVRRFFICPFSYYNQSTRNNEYEANEMFKLLEKPYHIDSNRNDLRETYLEDKNKFEFVTLSSDESDLCIAFIEGEITYIQDKELDSWDGSKQELLRIANDLVNAE